MSWRCIETEGEIGWSSPFVFFGNIPADAIAKLFVGIIVIISGFTANLGIEIPLHPKAERANLAMHKTDFSG